MKCQTIFPGEKRKKIFQIVVCSGQFQQTTYKWHVSYFFFQKTEFDISLLNIGLHHFEFFFLIFPRKKTKQKNNNNNNTFLSFSFFFFFFFFGGGGGCVCVGGGGGYIINLSFAELARRVIKVKAHWYSCNSLNAGLTGILKYTREIYNNHWYNFQKLKIIPWSIVTKIPNIQHVISRDADDLYAWNCDKSVVHWFCACALSHRTCAQTMVNLSYTMARAHVLRWAMV